MGRAVPALECSLGVWVKYALQVTNSPFAKDLYFIFFVHSVLRRKRLTGLAAHAPIRKWTPNAIVDVREMLQSETPKRTIANRIDMSLRSGI